ncbi:hypothetical protein ACWGII_32790 [Streptomyces sp. NPDC054855]
MAIDFASRRITFSAHTGSPQDVDQVFSFPANVRKAETFVNGFNIGFEGTDHEFFRQEVNTAVRAINGNVVTVRTVFSLRDSSGNFDDPFSGFVDVVVVADLL